MLLLVSLVDEVGVIVGMIVVSSEGDEMPWVGGDGRWWCGSSFVYLYRWWVRETAW